MMLSRCTVAAAGAISGAMLFVPRWPPLQWRIRNPHRRDQLHSGRHGPSGYRRRGGDVGVMFEHPDVNDFFTGLKGTPRSEMRAKLQQYMDANPQVHADLEGIRQPMIDFRSRCQVGQSADNEG